MDLMIIFLYILLLHWIGDFVLQSNAMALNKSKSHKFLGIHVGIYSLTLLAGLALFLSSFVGEFGMNLGTFLVSYVALNGALHYVTDFFTSRLTSKLWSIDRHWFFVAIGFDQLIHIMCLGISLMIMLG